MADCVYEEKEVFNPPAKTLIITEDGTYPVLGLEAVEVAAATPPVIEPLSVTENGEYTAPEGVDGYNPVTVNAPSSSYKLLASRTYNFSQEPPTTPTVIDTFQLDPSDVYTSGKIICSVNRNKTFSGGASEYAGRDFYYVNANPFNHTSANLTQANRVGFGYYTDNSGNMMISYSGRNTSGGIYVDAISADGTITVSVRFVSEFGSMVGEHSLDIYSLEWPDDKSPME